MSLTLVIEVKVGCMSVCLCKTKDCVIKAGKCRVLYSLSEVDIKHVNQEALH